MAKAVGLDTHILFWGIQEKAKPHDVDMLPLAKNLIADLEKRKARIVIPSVALGEFLLGYPANAHFEILQTFQKRFQILPYDGAAAVHAARIYQSVHRDILKQEAPDITHGMIRADSQILGTLLANGIESIYSHDKGMQKIGRAFLRVEEMPLTLALSDEEETEE